MRTIAPVFAALTASEGATESGGTTISGWWLVGLIAVIVVAVLGTFLALRIGLRGR